MWPRFCEIVTALWIIGSAMLLTGQKAEQVSAIVFGTLILVLSIAAFFRPLRRAHLGTLLVALLMIGFPYLRPSPASALLQNVMICGLIVAMFAIIPNHSQRPPASWTDLERDRAGRPA